MDLTEALGMLIQGVRLVGDAVITIITIVLTSIGVEVPEIAIRIGAIILVILTLWKLSGAVSKIVLYAMMFMVISMFAGLVPAMGQYLSRMF